MKTNKFKKFSKFFIPFAQVLLGICLGYFFSNFLAGSEVNQQGILNSITFNIGTYKLHLHHWLWGAGVLISKSIFNFSFPLPNFFSGFFAGLIFQGIYNYSDWYKILSR